MNPWRRWAYFPTLRAILLGLLPHGCGVVWLAKVTQRRISKWGDVDKGISVVQPDEWKAWNRIGCRGCGPHLRCAGSCGGRTLKCFVRKSAETDLKLDLRRRTTSAVGPTFTTASVLTRCARLPTATAAWSSGEISSIAFHRSSRSSNLLAPSASTIRSLFPLPCSIPCRTAPPFPKFFRSVTTRISLPEYFPASLSAKSEVPSDEPSSMMRISKVRLGSDWRWSIVDSSMEGNREVSLYAGITTVRSMEAFTSLRDPNGSGLDLEVTERYFFSDSAGRMVSGDHTTSTV